MPDEKPVPETLDTIAEKVTALSASVDKRFADVDKRFADVDRRFDEVSEAIAEQRQYTEFAFGQLREELLRELGNTQTEMRAGFSKLDRKLDRVLSALPGTSSPRRRRRS